MYNKKLRGRIIFITRQLAPYYATVMANDANRYSRWRYKFEISGFFLPRSTSFFWKFVKFWASLQWKIIESFCKSLQSKKQSHEAILHNYHVKACNKKPCNDSVKVSLNDSAKYLSGSIDTWMIGLLLTRNSSRSR